MGNFIITYGDKGTGVHNAGELFKMSAETHEREVKTRLFPKVPSFQAGDAISTHHISTVSELTKLLEVGNVTYLAYFGHSWDGALYIGEANAPDTNLGNAGGANDTSVAKLAKEKFGPGAQIRLFGCRAGFGGNPIAAQIRQHLGVKVFAYSNSGGSLFTQDKKLGYGQRAVKKSDIEFKAFNKLKDTWLIPINGTPNFVEF